MSLFHTKLLYVYMSLPVSCLPWRLSITSGITVIGKCIVLHCTHCLTISTQENKTNKHRDQENLLFAITSTPCLASNNRPSVNGSASRQFHLVRVFCHLFSFLVRCLSSSSSRHSGLVANNYLNCTAITTMLWRVSWFHPSELSPVTDCQTTPLSFTLAPSNPFHPPSTFQHWLDFKRLRIE